MAGHGYTGFVDNSNGSNAHENFLDLIESKALLNGWTTLRKTNTGGTGDARSYELIMVGVGLSGTEQIYVGFQCLQSSSSDYYNIQVATMTGYVAGNTFATQPGFTNSGVCAHNTRIDYWLFVNAQHIHGALKVGNPVYEPFYVGKFFPWATPSQYPYPVMCMGTLNRAALTQRYSSVDGNQHRSPFGGWNNSFSATTAQQCNIRLNDGNWYSNKGMIPYVGAGTAGTLATMRETNGIYHLTPLQPCEVADGSASIANLNVFGELDGVFHCSGFNLTVESTTVVNGKTYVMIQDINRNAIDSYVAMEITP